jgi:sulfur-carrier protein
MAVKDRLQRRMVIFASRQILQNNGKGERKMSVNIVIPTLLRKLTGDSDLVELEAGTITEVLEKLDENYPGFRARVCEPGGDLRQFINIYVNGEDIRFLDNLSTSIPSGAEVSIVPAIAGG